MALHLNNHLCVTCYAYTSRDASLHFYFYMFKHSHYMDFDESMYSVEQRLDVKLVAILCIDCGMFRE